jgi:hypothetical protein
MGIEGLGGWHHWRGLSKKLTVVLSISVTPGEMPSGDSQKEHCWGSYQWNKGTRHTDHQYLYISRAYHPGWKI